MRALVRVACGCRLGRNDFARSLDVVGCSHDLHPQAGCPPIEVTDAASDLDDLSNAPGGSAALAVANTSGSPERTLPASSRRSRGVAWQCRRPCFIGPGFFHRAARDLARHHEHSGHPQLALQREAMFCQFLNGRSLQRARIISISGVRRRVCVALLEASTCAARPWAESLE